MERINDIRDILDLGIAFGNFIFRGHQNIIDSKPLIPKTFRGYEEANEKYYINEFIRYARGYIDSFPNDKSSILFLMQHYGLPTRLLDWSTSILIATYFAVSGSKDNDGEIWVLNPDKLKEFATKNNNYRDIVTSFVDEPFSDTKKNENDNLKIPIVIKPNHFDKRMIAQQSVFTIHSNKSIGIDKIGLNSLDFERFLIPANMKSVIYRHLYDLGISERTIYPDIEGLTRDIYKNRGFRHLNQVYGEPIKNAIRKPINK